MATSHLTPKQCLRIKSLIMDTNNHLNKVFSSFDSLNKEFSPGSHLVNIFSDQFSFISVNHKDLEALVTHQSRLNNIYKNSLTKYDTVFIVIDASVKNNVATSILHICRGQEIIAKTVYYVMNMTFSKAELFAIRYGINYTT